MKKSTFCLAAAIVWSVGAGASYAQVINEDLKLTANDAASDDNFGESIAIDQGIVAVGASRDNDAGFNSGSVYLFDAQTGIQMAKLTASDAVGEGQFGGSVAIAQGIVAVGAWGDDEGGGFSGSAYLFDVQTGTQLIKLTASDAAAFDTFGWSIAIDQGIVAVGAVSDDDAGINSGSAYLFDAQTGDQLAKLTASDAAAVDWFGSSIAIDQGIVAVGAPRDDDAGFDSGSAYLFDAQTGAQLAKLTASDAAADDWFGWSVAIDQGIVAIGAHGDGINSGSVYLFDVQTGTQLAKLAASDAAASDRFGWSVAIDQGIVAVGARGDVTDSGSAYFFDAQTGTLLAKLAASDAAAGDQFGNSISINQGIVVVGARLDDDAGSGSGSAYLFNVACPVDLTGDGVLNFFDVSAFIVAFTANDPIADFNNDGEFNFFDISEFITAFIAGCP